MAQYSGVCLCHGVMVTGTPAVSQPKPYYPPSIFGERRQCWLLVNEHGAAHDVPVDEAKEGDG